MPLPRLAGVFQFAFGFNFEQPVVVELEEELGSSENRSSWRIDVFWFLELEEELGLFCEIMNGRRRSGTRTWNGRQGWNSKSRRSGKTRQALRYKNRRSWRIDVSLFLELKEKLALFFRNHFYVSFALPKSEGVLLVPTFQLRG